MTTVAELENRVVALEKNMELIEQGEAPISIPCPECGIDLEGRDISVHQKMHWGPHCPDPRIFKEAARRWEILEEEI